MKILFKDEYIVIKYDEEYEILYCIWNEKSTDITGKEIKNIIAKIAELLRQYMPMYVLSDESKRAFAYNIDIQKWVMDIMINALKYANVKKYAIILPTELIALLSTEQIVDSAPKLFTKISYAKDEADAKSWFISTRYTVLKGGLLKEY